ncbi:protein lin-54 homolog isoform X2 [Drosophila eugracilis]|uniref:protein lin-54 homolog isoform X2 n=1 Tax=Drosophila eugracilis TaxID=29029 RepID=UPI001BD9D78B|nr:protein lin-54 homolog isoform X2 [Drosophila eugracilis]
MDTSGGNLDSLDETEPLPELSFEDLLETASEKSSQHMEIDTLDSDEDHVEGDVLSEPANDSLNTPQFKKNVVHILDDKRLPPSGVTVLKSHAIKVVTAGGPSPNKPQITDVKILNKLKPIPSNTVKIGNTTIATASAPGTVTKTLSSLTQFKTKDGQVIFVQKSVPATQSSTMVTGSPSGGMRRLVAPTGIHKAVLSKGVTLASTGLVKAAVPGKTVTPASTTAITIKGIQPLAGVSAKSVSPSTSSTTSLAQPTKIQVVRTTDGKIIKINQAVPSVLLNAKPPGTGSAVTPGTSATTTVKLSPSTGTVLLNKPVGQSVKTEDPGKQSSISTGSTSRTTTTPGKMLVQSGSKQILVSSKNIIKLSPTAGATSTITNTAGVQTSSTSGLHAIQLPGKGGVQYVRVLTNNKSGSGTSTTGTTPKTMQAQKITVVRSPAAVAAASCTPATSTPISAAVAPSTAAPKTNLSIGSTNKIVMRTMGGSIVPLPSVQTLVHKRALGASTNASKPVSAANSSTSGSPSVMQESPRKHRLTDLNMQLKHLASASSDASDSSDAGPEAKKPRYVITMQGAQQASQSAQKLSGRPSNVQRVVTSNTSPNAPKKIYNFVKSTGANGVKYMICNSGVPQSSTSAMRRGYTGYVDNKLRRTLAVSSQQHRFKQMNPQQQTKHLQLQAQAKQRIRQQQQLTQQSAPIKVDPKLPTQPPIQKPSVPAKPLFDILKPPSTGAAVDALGGMTSRRKHCNCSKSQCLKLYCDCFANGEFCQDCTCKDCFNNLDYEVERERAIRSCLDRNPSAFKPKITAPNSGDMRLHNKGCNCKRSGCLKNYCECYEAKIPCTSICKCVGCRNMEDRPDVDMDSLDGLVGTKGQKKDKANDKDSHENRANMYFTDDVIEATIMCMISRIVMHEKQNMPVEDTEREVMEELGESLNQIITFAKEKHDNSHLDESKATL